MPLEVLNRLLSTLTARRFHLTNDGADSPAGPADGRMGGRSTPNTGGNRKGIALFRKLEQAFLVWSDRPLTAHYQRKRPATFLPFLETLKVNRSYYLCPTFHHRAVPLGQELGLCAGPTNAPAGVQLPFEEAAHSVCPDTIRKATKGLGQVAVEGEHGNFDRFGLRACEGYSTCPLQSDFEDFPGSCYNFYGRLAQLVRAPPLQGGGHRFDSCTAHLTKNARVKAKRSSNRNSAEVRSIKVPRKDFPLTPPGASSQYNGVVSSRIAETVDFRNRD